MGNRSAGTLAVLIAVCIGAAAESKREEFRYPVGPAPVVSITNQNGRIVVNPASTNEVVATVTHSDQVNVQAKRVENRITIESKRSDGGREGENADYQVLVPVDAVVILHSCSGLIMAQNLKGDLVFSSEGSSVEVSGASDAHIHISTLDGPVTVSNVAHSQLDITTDKGNVTLRDVSSTSVTVRSATGRIQYDGDPGSGVYALTSRAGDIDVSLPKTASVKVEAKSMKGKVDNPLPADETSDPAAGGIFHGLISRSVKAASLVLHSFRGNIHIRQKSK
ncbi:MAG TPA: DUF4097 family beta strand repeat-containing protein [Terriglobales bacterium]